MGILLGAILMLLYVSTLFTISAQQQLTRLAPFRNFQWRLPHPNLRSGAHGHGHGVQPGRGQRKWPSTRERRQLWPDRLGHADGQVLDHEQRWRYVGACVLRRVQHAWEDVLAWVRLPLSPLVAGCAETDPPPSPFSPSPLPLFLLVLRPSVTTRTSRRSTSMPGLRTTSSITRPLPSRRSRIRTIQPTAYFASL